ncbi:NAC transcription factor 56-like [Eucalyptus grandis]|uniref:NAC transcription factor 56-like n=1 Tax=Eucalyptus grandis TaxID=71139 RepID=UPI00192E8B88|nr:NAC transcription factor 56-like [Eucalyptus grandis]
MHDVFEPRTSGGAAVAVIRGRFPARVSTRVQIRPTDEDLILYYLKPKIAGDPIPLADFFADVDLYQFDPRELIESHKAAGKGEDEWYFFTPRDRKYPNGSRPNRRTPGGFWKATTKDSVIQMENMTIGYKRLLAFFEEPRQDEATGRP